MQRPRVVSFFFSFDTVSSQSGANKQAATSECRCCRLHRCAVVPCDFVGTKIAAAVCQSRSRDTAILGLSVTKSSAAMAYLTQVMLAEAEASSLDEQFATIVIREDEMKEYLKQHHDFRLLDQVFIDFLSSNRHRRRNWTFEQLLSVKSPSPGKEFVYDSSGVPYRGAVWLYEGGVCCLQ